MAQVLEVRNVEKTYGSKGNVVRALDGLDFFVEEGDFLGIMGQSGSGKTTLLNVISTIDRVTGGAILLDGKDITKLPRKSLAKFRRENLGFIFQDFNLLDNLTIRENIALALTIYGEKGANIDGKINAIAQKLAITAILEKFPYQVSGGEKQRAAAARAIITKPRLILADEPTGALDSKSARMLLETMGHLNREMEAAILMVTHDAFTASFCKRIVFIKDGRIFTELIKGDDTRKEYFDKILHVISLLGGDVNDVR